MRSPFTCVWCSPFLSLSVLTFLWLVSEVFFLSLFSASVALSPYINRDRKAGRKSKLEAFWMFPFFSSDKELFRMHVGGVDGWFLSSVPILLPCTDRDKSPLSKLSSLKDGYKWVRTWDVEGLWRVECCGRVCDENWGATEEINFENNLCWLRLFKNRLAFEGGEPLSKFALSRFLLCSEFELLLFLLSEPEDTSEFLLLDCVMISVGLREGTTHGSCKQHQRPSLNRV